MISGAGNIQKAVSGSFSGGVKLSLGHKVNVLAKSHVIGISIGYGIRLRGSLSLEGDEIEADGQLSTYAIPVELFYSMPVGKKSFFRLASGVDFYKAKIINPVEPLAGSTLGGHLSLETGLKLGKKLAMTLNAGYLLAKLKEFKTSDGKIPVENLRLDLRGLKFSFGFRFRLK